MRSPETVARTIDKYRKHLWQNLDALNQTDLTPFDQEAGACPNLHGGRVTDVSSIHIDNDIGDLYRVQKTIWMS